MPLWERYGRLQVRVRVVLGFCDWIQNDFSLLLFDIPNKKAAKYFLLNSDHRWCNLVVTFESDDF